MLYPPILANTQPVFNINASSFEVEFTLADITETTDFSEIDLLIAQQSNNASVINTETGYETYGIIMNDRSGALTVYKSQLKSDYWQPGQLYKVQLRLRKSFDSAQQVPDQVSEWSTVMIIKPIEEPSIEISSEGTVLSNGNTVVPSLTPTFHGKCIIPINNKEPEESFRFTIYSGNNLLLDSGWLPHVTGSYEDSWYCNSLLEHRKSYSLVYEVKTTNGFYTSTPPVTDEQVYSFVTIQSTGGDLGVIFRARSNINNACVDLYLVKDELEELTGNFVISRSSEKTNFQQFEDIQFLNYGLQSIKPEYLAFSDYTIESGVTYQYSFQQILAGQRRTNLNKTGKIAIDLQYSYFYRDGIQLRVSLNQNVSSFKHTVLRNKQDTLGDQYPHLSQNGTANYIEFSISGLISYQDNLSTFFKPVENQGVYYNSELIVPYSKFEKRSSSEERGFSTQEDIRTHFEFNHKTTYNFGVAEGTYIVDDESYDVRYAKKEDMVATENRRGENPIDPPDPAPHSIAQEIDFSISTDLTDNNIYIERRFREKVEEFLNTFNYKLYRSPTEGNIVVALMNVTLKPMQQVGRMLYEFSATAYEVLSTSLTELDAYGVINIGKEEELSEVIPTVPSFGQVIISPDNIDLLPVSQSNANQIDIRAYIAQLEKINIDEVYEYNLNRLSRLWIESYPSESYKLDSNFRTILLNSSEIIMPTKKIFTIEIPWTSETETLTIKKDQLIGKPQLVINYQCDLKIDKKSETHIIESTETKLEFDQLVWNGYYFDPEDEPVFENLLSVIQNHIINENGYVVQDDGRWTNPDKTVEYRFDHLNSIDIETQTGAIIRIGLNEENYAEYTVGFHKLVDGGPYIRNKFDSSRIIFPILREQGDAHGKFLQIARALQAIVNFTYYIEEITSSSGEEEEEPEG